MPNCIIPAYLFLFKDNKEWGEDEVDENSQDGGGAASSSTGGETEAAQTEGAGATDSDGNVNKANADRNMDTGT